jgi:uncharacterized protein (DUF1501 family)
MAVNGDLIVTMVVQNIASVAPEENELGNKWTLTVSAQDHGRRPRQFHERVGQRHGPVRVA